MFVHEGVKIYADLNQLVINGTDRPQDLIPTFLSVIRDTVEYVQLMVSNSVPAYATEDEDADWWEGDACFALNDTLFDVLDGYAPEGYYFGDRPDEDTNFGYWKGD